MCIRDRVSICLGLQELPQLEEQYGKATAKTITSIIGNTLSGQAKAPDLSPDLVNNSGRRFLLISSLVKDKSFFISCRLGMSKIAIPDVYKRQFVANLKFQEL